MPKLTKKAIRVQAISNRIQYKIFDSNGALTMNDQLLPVIYIIQVNTADQQCTTKLSVHYISTWIIKNTIEHFFQL
jgi:hypothetical protein